MKIFQKLFRIHFITIVLLITLLINGTYNLTSPYTIEQANGFASGIVTLIDDTSSNLSNGTYHFPYRYTFNSTPSCIIGIVAYQGGTVVFTQIAFFTLTSITPAIFYIGTDIGPTSNSRIVLLKISYLATTYSSVITRSHRQTSFSNISSGTGLRQQTFVYSQTTLNLNNYLAFVSITGFSITSSLGYSLQGRIQVTNSISYAVTIYLNYNAVAATDGILYYVLLIDKSAVEQNYQYFIINSQFYQLSTAVIIQQKTTAQVFFGLTKFADSSSNTAISFQWTYFETEKKLQFTYPNSIMDTVSFVNIVGGKKQCNSLYPYWYNSSLSLCTSQCSSYEYKDSSNVCVICTPQFCSSGTSQSSNIVVIIIPVVLVLLLLITSLIVGYCIWRRFFAKNRIKPYRREIDVQTKNSLPDITL